MSPIAREMIRGSVESSLPEPRGELSAAIADALRQKPGTVSLPVRVEDDIHPFGEDLALALHTCYELHYRGFAEVDEEWEWEPSLLRLRAALERRFLAGLRSGVAGGDDVRAAIDPLLLEPVPGNGVTHYLRDRAGWWQMREYVVHRSIYHLKEADPQAWVIPRLQGRPKAAVVAVEFDEYGGGRADRLHAKLFAEMMTGLGLSADYLHYLDVVPAPAISSVNLMSMFGLHRRWRGALIGQFAVLEITSSPGSERLTKALERLGTDAPTRRFYTEHIEADAMHEQLLRAEVVGGLLDQDPSLAADVVFGVQTAQLLDDQFADHAMTAWGRGETSLRRPLPEHAERE